MSAAGKFAVMARPYSSGFWAMKITKETPLFYWGVFLDEHGETRQYYSRPQRFKKDAVSRLLDTVSEALTIAAQAALIESTYRPQIKELDERKRELVGAMHHELTALLKYSDPSETEQQQEAPHGGLSEQGNPRRQPGA